MTLDARARATANKLLVKFGKNCTYKSIIEGTADAVTGMPNSTSYPVKLYLDAPNSIELAGGQVSSNSSVALIAAAGLAVTPKLNDYIAVDGVDRQVTMVGATWSGELVALWRLGLKS